MCRKKFEPHKCEYIPQSEALSFILSMKTVFEAQFKKYLAYREATKNARWGWQYREHWRVWRRSPEAKAIDAMLKLRFNYTDSYIGTGDACYRFLMIYKDHRDRIISLQERQEQMPQPLPV